MQKALRTITYNYHSPLNPAQLTVAQGEEFLAETELCTGGWLARAEDCWTPDKTCALNPTVVVAIDGAKPGDMLAVDVLRIEPDALGYTGFDTKLNPLAERIYPTDWGVYAKTVRLDGEFALWSDAVKLPLSPMIGTLGTAPAGEALSNARAGAHGGNMDVQEIAEGCTVYLPVEVDGALLHIGDVHALQGDGEINCSGGIECRSVVKLRARAVRRPEAYGCVRVENADCLMTVASDKSLETSFYLGVSQLLSWMEGEYGIPKKEGYLLLGQVMQARNTQFVNPTWSYVCKVPKKFLRRAQISDTISS
ncbi:MAG: acetamidase/formamidase family protein [Clostridiales bacterium]|jgi:acetamidase/formamidase|nr:acetamidase/formamidase family protein [Clostridiales bacterium]